MFARSRHEDVENLEFKWTDAENFKADQHFKSRMFDSVVCIESFRCFSDTDKVLSSIGQVLKNSHSRFVLADTFDKVEFRERVVP